MAGQFDGKVALHIFDITLIMCYNENVISMYFVH